MSGQTDNTSIIQLIAKHLSIANEPLHCYDLFDKPDIAELTKSTMVTSNYLSYMWRKGMVTRLPAGTTPGVKVRWVYQLNDKNLRVQELLKHEPSPATIAPTTHLGGRLDIDEENKTFTLRMRELTVTIKLH